MKPENVTSVQAINVLLPFVVFWDFMAECGNWNLKYELNGCLQSARQQANNLFAIATVYLGMHDDAHHVQHST